MLLNQIALIFCLILLFATKMSVVGAAKRGDLRQVRSLQFLRLGLGLSACSYLLRMTAPGIVAAFGSFLFCLGGSLLIWIGFREHLALTRERLARSREEKADGGEAEKTFPSKTGLPCLTSRAHQVLEYAEAEAGRQRQCVDTDHLLRGLLTVSESAGGHILDRLGVNQDNLRLSLGLFPAPSACVDRSAAEDPPLTARARAVFSLAAQEARRFDKDAVGTDHLLLGLVLAGTGTAASALFQAGATVDAIRHEILKDLLPA